MLTSIASFDLTRHCSHVTTTYQEHKCCDNPNAFPQISDLAVLVPWNLTISDDSIMHTFYGKDGTTGNFSVYIDCALQNTTVPVFTENCVATAFYYQMLTGSFSVPEFPVLGSVRRHPKVSKGFRVVTDLLTTQVNMGYVMSSYTDHDRSDTYGGPTAQAVSTAHSNFKMTALDMDGYCGRLQALRPHLEALPLHWSMQLHTNVWKIIQWVAILHLYKNAVLSGLTDHVCAGVYDNGIMNEWNNLQSDFHLIFYDFYEMSPTISNAVISDSAKCARVV